MIRQFLVINGLLLIVLLSACIGVPIPGTAAPFQKRLDFIQKGITTRAEVLGKLSGPDVVRMNERFFAYMAHERDLGLCFVVTLPVPMPPPAGCVAGGAAHFVGISFDDDGKVTRVDAAQAKITATDSGVSDWQACLGSGICLDYPSMMVLAPHGEDQAAKRFRPQENACAFYIIGVGAKDRQYLSLFLDGRDAGLIAGGAYLRWITSLGSHRIDGKLTGTRNDQDSVKSMSVTCEPGQMVFIQPDLDGNMRLLKETEGKQAVNLSKRLLDAF